MREALTRAWLVPLSALAQTPLAASALAENKGASAEILPSTLLVQLNTTAEMIGYPAVCPGSSPDANEEDIICMAELYEAKARVLKHLDGPETERNLTIRFTAHSFHAVWRRNVRFLLVVAPFEDKGAKGHFAHDWDWETDGKFCKAKEDLEDEWSSYQRIFAFGNTRTSGENDPNWSKGVELVCITGREEGL